MNLSNNFRGGKFTAIPASYPAGAWFTYDDTTCGYGCQVTEYVYWGMAAWVGALVGRKTEIQKEWRLETKAKLEAGDALLTALFKVETNESQRSHHDLLFAEHHCVQGAHHLPHGGVQGEAHLRQRGQPQLNIGTIAIKLLTMSNIILSNRVKNNQGNVQVLSQQVRF